MGSARSDQAPDADIGSTPARASVRDTAAVLAKVLAPTLGLGVIERRPRVLRFAEKRQLDRISIALLQRLRARYGPGPLRLALPGREIAIVLSPADVARVLDGAPEPFTPANLEKRFALRHFQPHGVLISQGGPRADRRDFNEAVLEPERPLHELAARVGAVLVEEFGSLPHAGELTWETFAPAWWRAVRRIVLGDAARDDDELTDMLAKLRQNANWAYLHPRQRGLRARFEARLREHTERAEPGSLAAACATVESDVDAVGQIPHWLFAFDAAGMSVMRALAVLSTHDDIERRAGTESSTMDAARAREFPLLRAVIDEAIRLWPTTPALLRDSTELTRWGATSLPTGTTFVIYTPLHHRDEQVLSYAHKFEPDIWLDGQAQRQPALVPFSAGPGRCPGRSLVRTVASTALAILVQHNRYEYRSSPELRPDRPLPATLDPFTVRLRVHPRDQ